MVKFHHEKKNPLDAFLILLDYCYISYKLLLDSVKWLLDSARWLLDGCLLDGSMIDC
jgi:hypothetical protein